MTDTTTPALQPEALGNFSPKIVPQDDAAKGATSFYKIERISALAIVPKRMVVPNHKLVNSLTRATRTPEDAIQIVLEVSKRGAKNKVTATCVLSYEGDNVKISGRQPFSEYDRNVYNAVVSLYVAGNRVITSDMVWRTMTGKT